jgi:outer membrane protein
MRRLALSLSLFALSMTDRLSAETLTWQQCLNEAAQNNAAIKSAYQGWRSTQSNVRSTESAYFPQVGASFQANYGRNMAIPQSQAGDSYTASISVSENIFNGWADRARIEQSQANSSIAEAQLVITKAQTSFELKTAYANLIYAQRAVRLQENIRDRRKSNLSLVDLRFENGSENKGSVLLSKAYLDQAELNIIQARNSITTASSQLARAMGRDEVTPLRVDESIPSINYPTSPNFEALATATPQRTQAVLREKAADSNITLVKAGYFPTLAVNGTYGRQDDEFFPRDDSWSVGLVINIPIFNGGRDYYATQGAISNRASVGSSREDLDRQLVTTLSTALARLIEAKKNLEVSYSFLKATETRAEIGRGRYNNGLLSFDDWDLIESDLISRQQAHILSQRDYVAAEAAWENALGTGSIK